MKQEIIAFLDWLDEHKDYKLMREEYRLMCQWETQSATSLEIESYINEYIEQKELLNK